MQKQPAKQKKRNIYIDVFLITAIFSIFTVIIILTITKEQPKKEVVSTTNDFTISSDTTESDSPFPTIKIVLDVSNDQHIPFAIQYPLTEHMNINKEITAYIENIKTDYINQLRQDENKTKQGDLNISFEIAPHKEHFYSFIIKTIQSIADEAPNEIMQTFFFNNESGELYSIRDLLSNNDDSLHSISTQVYATFKKDKRYTYDLRKHVRKLTAANWENHHHFAIADDSIIFYYNSIIQPETNLPTTVSIPLTAINPYLHEQFQIVMEKPVQQIIDPNSGSNKRVALTFDDGPHPDVTPQILALLEKYNARATFFMLGSRVHYYPEIANDVYLKGHEVGNHTWNHPMLTKLSKVQIVKEFTTTEKAIVEATGKHSTVFRPPYGATNEKVQQAIDSLHVNWTIDTEDWKYRQASKLLPNVKNAMHNNSIILMHDIHQSTADGLEAVLKYLQKNGYEFVTVSEMMEQK